jgi:hypothetical protein
VVLSALLDRHDFRNTPATPKDRQRLRLMISACRADHTAMASADAAANLERLKRAAGLA